MLPALSGQKSHSWGTKCVESKTVSSMASSSVLRTAYLKVPSQTVLGLDLPYVTFFDASCTPTIRDDTSCGRDLDTLRDSTAVLILQVAFTSTNNVTITSNSPPPECVTWKRNRLKS
jgi:hypothetical protein